MPYQISIDRDAHLANMAGADPIRPVVWLIEVLPGDVAGVKRCVHQVACTGPSKTEYGWGLERSHSRGERFGASIWVYTDDPVDYLDDNGWHRAD